VDLRRGRRAVLPAPVLQAPARQIARTIGFWLQLGLSGFRVDTVPFLLETAGQDDPGQLPDPHDYLADLRAFLGRRSGEGVLLGRSTCLTQGR
jgi:glycosidase